MEFKFILFTNTFNPHMEPLASELCAILKDNFKFIYIEKLDEERKNLGWSDKTDKYVSYYFDNPKENQKDIDMADVVYFGANPNMFSYIKKRIYSGKLTYFHEERVLKHGLLQFFIPKYTKYYIEQRIKPTRLDNVYVFAASGFLFKDLKKLHANTDRVQKFGYFPKFYEYNFTEIIKTKLEKYKNRSINFLCCGRLIKLKHFDDVIRAFSMLKKQLKDCELKLTIVGNGIEEKNLKFLSKKLHIENSIDFTGSMSPEKVREYMLKTDVFIASSDKREGWGAVVNEAMNSISVPIVSDAMGSSPFLIDGNNGLTYKSGNVKDLFEKMLFISTNYEYFSRAIELSYKTISEKWNPKIVAQRLIEFSSGLLNEKMIQYDDGPLSQARCIK